MKCPSVVYLVLILIAETPATIKGLPVGLSKIQEILQHDHVYVDKTGYLLNLIQQGPRHIIISRPGKFGKSLFLSTAEQIFKGNKELFRGTQIYRSNYNWRRYSVMHFDFGQFDSTKRANFKNDLTNELQEVAKLHGIVIDESQQRSFFFLLKILTEKLKPIVVLVDNYDTPILNNLKDSRLAEEFRRIIMYFFEVLKNLDVEYTFIVGVCKFILADYHGGANHVIDISTHPKYAELMGYTEEELNSNFGDHIRNIAEKRLLPEKNITNEMRAWYYGYRFSGKGCPVYNPYSSMSYLRDGKARNYISETNNQESAIDVGFALHVNGSITPKQALERPHGVDEIIPDTLFFENGYLTITQNRSDAHHDLNFPNKEVECAVCNAALQGALKSASEDTSEAKEMVNYLTKLDLDNFMYKMNSRVKRVFNAFKYADGKFFQKFFLSKLHASGIKTHPVSDGVKTESDERFYIFEITLDRTVEEALLRTGEYENEVLHKKKDVLVMGINYLSVVTRFNWYCDWKANLYSQDRSLKKSLSPTKKS